MLNCLKDVLVPEDSKCAKCCIYCSEKEKCEYVCFGLEEWKTEAEIAKNCIECEDETQIYKKRCRKRIWSFTSDYGNGAKHIETYALLSNPKTHRMEKVYLRLNYDASGYPYLIADNMENKENRKKK